MHKKALMRTCYWNKFCFWQILRKTVLFVGEHKLHSTHETSLLRVVVVFIILLLPLQKTGCSGCVFLGRILKNAAQNCLKPRFLKTGLKDKRSSRVRSNGALAQVLSPVFDRCSRVFVGLVLGRVLLNAT